MHGWTGAPFVNVHTAAIPNFTKMFTPISQFLEDWFPNLPSLIDATAAWYIHTRTVPYRRPVNILTQKVNVSVTNWARRLQTRNVCMVCEQVYNGRTVFTLGTMLDVKCHIGYREFVQLKDEISRRRIYKCGGFGSIQMWGQRTGRYLRSRLLSAVYSSFPYFLPHAVNCVKAKFHYAVQLANRSETS